MREFAELVLFLRDAHRPEDLVEFVDRIRVQGGADAFGGWAHNPQRARGCARSHCLRITNISAAAHLKAEAPIRVPVSAERSPIGHCPQK